MSITINGPTYIVEQYKDKADFLKGADVAHFILGISFLGTNIK